MLKYREKDANEDYSEYEVEGDTIQVTHSHLDDDSRSVVITIDGIDIVVTDLGVYHFDDDGEMRLDTIHPEHTLEDVGARFELTRERIINWNRTRDQFVAQQQARVDELRAAKYEDILAANPGIELRRGFASFADAHTLVVRGPDGSEQSLTPDRVFVIRLAALAIPKSITFTTGVPSCNVTNTLEGFRSR